MKIYFLGWLCCFLATYAAQAQTSNSVILAKKPNFQTQLYYDSLDTTPGIYTGAEHQYYSFRIEGNPFFFSDDIAPTDIHYNGFLYQNIEAYYDLHLQAIIVEHDNMSFAIRLDNKRISHFKMYEHKFVHLDVDSISGMKSGFYDLVVDGPVKFFVRREKELRKEIDNQIIREWFEPLTRYYVLKDGSYHRIKRRGQILKLFGDKKKELKTFIKQQRISIRTFPEDGFEKIINHYNEL